MPRPTSNLSPRTSTRKSRVVLTLFTLAAFGILIALGVWQLQRRDWKNDLIARFEQAPSKPPIPYQPPRNVDDRTREFARVTATGTLEEAKTVEQLVPTPEAVRAQTQDGSAIYFLRRLSSTMAWCS